MRSKSLRLLLGATTAAAALGFAYAPAFAQKKYGPGVTDTEIKLGQTMPYSGPASLYGSIGKVEQAYFQMINDRGGINGRKINLISYDDSYNPPKAVEQVRKLVESDEVLATFQTLGTPSNAAIQKYLNAKKVPMLLVSSGATRFSDPKNSPYTVGFNPSYQTEGRIYARYILKNHPDAKIGILYQNDDLGKDYVVGLKDGLGAKAATMIVSEAPYEVTDPTIDSQILKLKSDGATLLYDVTTPKFAAQAIKKLADLNWKPLHILDINATSVGGVMTPAGLDNSEGIISTTYGKDPMDPTFQNDADMKEFFKFMETYVKDGDKFSTFNSYGYAAASLMAQVLKQCGDDLTRENILKQATNIHKFHNVLAINGIDVDNSSADYRIVKQLILMRFEKGRWQTFGPILSDDSQG